MLITWRERERERERERGYSSVKQSKRRGLEEPKEMQGEFKGKVVSSTVKLYL